MSCADSGQWSYCVAETLGTAQLHARLSKALKQERIIAVGLLTRNDVQLLGPTFDRLWPVEEVPCFSGLLRAIDEADRRLWRECDRASERG